MATGTALLTGANSSLALLTVKHPLQNYPTYHLVLTVRNTSPSDPNTMSLRTIISEFPSSSTSIYALDLSSIAAVEAFASAIVTKIKDGTLPPLKTIICNAYAWSITTGLKHSQDGYELSLAVNHIAHFSLVLRLLGSFALSPTKGRIIFLGSDSHYPDRSQLAQFPPGIPDDLEELSKPGQDKKGEEVGRGFQRYGNSKLVIVMMMYELNRQLLLDEKLKNIHVIAIDPGALPASRAMSKDVPKAWQYGVGFVAVRLQPLLKYFIPALRLLKKAGADLAEISVSEKYENERCYYTCLKKDESSTESQDKEKQERVWVKSLEWARIGKGGTVLKNSFE
ncbi:hypothetical protein G7Y89_g2117 [Cudoniella acicularis]|uniref:NAD(P)-binding protein n=1 Tax=Cudoniella acicularis TaxID=354080 RepID=A0A8H4RV42_9HELO|nr:hypothetical protein G7Y89_g2117 [Cudoniella acicularis]